MKRAAIAMLLAVVAVGESYSFQGGGRPYDPLVYFNGTGSHYHTRSCKTITKSNRPLQRFSRSQAKKKGLRACAFCGAP